MKCPVLYVAASADSTAVEWVHHAIQHELTEKLLSGEVTLPGFHARPKEAPAEVLSQAPPSPQLNVCVLQQGILTVPQVVVQQWATNHWFQQLLSDLIKEFGEAPPENMSVPAALSLRPKSGAQWHPWRPSRLTASVKLAQAAVVGLKKDIAGKVMVRVSTDRSWLLLNMSQTSVALPAGTVVAGFGTGAFKHVPRLAAGKLGASDVEKHVLFDLKNAESKVLHNGKLTTLGDLVNAAQGSRASADICYHTLKPAPSEDPRHFELDRKHEVYYIPSPKATNLELKGSSSLAALVPLSTCKFEHCNRNFRTRQSQAAAFWPALMP